MACLLCTATLIHLHITTDTPALIARFIIESFVFHSFYEFVPGNTYCRCYSSVVNAD